jgi:ABC-2 type transport system permease protein
MKPLANALWAESLKIRKSKIFLITLFLFAFIGVMMGLLVLLGRHPEIAGRSAAMGAKASVVGSADWPSFWNLLNQVILSLGMMGFGVAASWVFGREYTDRVVKDLLALPVSRSTIVLSKTIVTAIWCVILSLLMWTVGLLAGLAFTIPHWSMQAARDGFATFMLSSSLTMLLCAPVAFVASLGRGYLLPIGFVLLSLIMTNLVGVGAPGFAPYFPWVFPALVSGVGGQAVPHPNAGSAIIFIATVIAGYAGTVLWWRYADQM